MCWGQRVLEKHLVRHRAFLSDGARFEFLHLASFLFVHFVLGYRFLGRNSLDTIAFIVLYYSHGKSSLQHSNRCRGSVDCTSVS